jgi:hypothetical protein
MIDLLLDGALFALVGLFAWAIKPTPLSDT